MLKLVTPNASMEAEAVAYIREHQAHGETDLHGGNLLEQKATYAEWLRHLERQAKEDTCNPDWVPSSTFFAVREADGKLVGIIDIRHRLNSFLQAYGGHIGYGVRPSERQKGYATEILRLGLIEAKRLGVSRVMLACYSDNLASSRTITKNGGQLERQFCHTDGKDVRVYWVSCE